MWLYNLGLTLYVWAIRLVAPRHPKARLWIEGRKDLFRRMREAIAPEDRVIWIHVASLGEFEQGRPIVEQLRRSHPEYKILITFFSPSGYEIRKNYPGADYIFYLPIDTPRNARRFLDAAHPEIARQLTTADYLPIAEYNRLVRGLEKDGEYLWETYCWLSFCTACRASDVRTLRWKDILGKSTMTRIEQKTKKNRLIKFNRDVQEKNRFLYEMLGQPAPEQFFKCIHPA